MEREERLLQVIVRLTGSLVGDYDLSDFLHTLAEGAAEVLAVGSVGVLLAEAENPARLSLAAASSSDARAIELFQMQRSEGPCYDAFRSGKQVVEEDVAGATGRWPQWVPRALQPGIKAVYAFPMRLHEDCIGALNLFRVERGPFEEADIVAAQALADVATIGILRQRTLHLSEVRTEQLQHALDSRVVIEQAKGILAERLGLSLDEAFGTLRAHARSNNRLLRDVAAAVVTNPSEAASMAGQARRTRR